MASNWFMDMASGIGDMASGAVDTVGGWFGAGGSSIPMGGAPVGSTSFGKSPMSPSTGMNWTGTAPTESSYDMLAGGVPGQYQSGGTMGMPSATGAAAAAGTKPTTGTGATPAAGGTGDIANMAGDVSTFKSELSKTGFMGRTPKDAIQVGDYAMTPDQFSRYAELGSLYGVDLVDKALGVQGENSASWFEAKGVPIAKMALAGGSLYLGSKTADAFKKQMEASSKVAQKNIENQTALINTYMYDRQAARYAANPEGEQTPEEYMAEHGL